MDCQQRPQASFKTARGYAPVTKTADFRHGRSGTRQLVAEVFAGNRQVFAGLWIVNGKVP
jgi:hypothetical protein